MHWYMLGFSLSLVIFMISYFKRDDIQGHLDSFSKEVSDSFTWRATAAFILALIIGLMSWIGVLGMTAVLIRRD